MGSNSDAPPLEILLKADAVLSALEQERECSVQRIAEVVGEPVSSTYRLLASMTAVGLAARGTKRGLYRLGFLPLRVGGMLEDQLDIRELGAPVLYELSRTTGATVLLWVRRGNRAVCIERTSRADVRTAVSRLGDSMPLWSPAAGRVLLANLPEAEASALIAGFDLGTGIAQELAGDLVRIRAQGYCLADGTSIPGVASISAPVLNHRGELEAALSINGLRRRILEDGGVAADEVRAAAGRLSVQLGFGNSDSDRQKS